MDSKPTTCRLYLLAFKKQPKLQLNNFHSNQKKKSFKQKKQNKNHRMTDRFTTDINNIK